MRTLYLSGCSKLKSLPAVGLAAQAARRAQSRELRDPLRVAHRAALHYRHYSHYSHYRRCRRPPAAPTAARDWRGLCSRPSSVQTARVGSGLLRRPFRGRAAHRDRLRRGRRRGYPQHVAAGRAARAGSGRWSAWADYTHAHVRHGADARPTAGGDNRTVPATNANDGWARTSTSLRQQQ